MFEVFIFGASGYFISAYFVHVGFGFLLGCSSEEMPSRHDDAEESIKYEDENSQARRRGYADRSDEVSSRS